MSVLPHCRKASLNEIQIQTFHNCRLEEESAHRQRFEQEAEAARLRNERREAERRWADKVKVKLVENSFRLG